MWQTCNGDKVFKVQNTVQSIKNILSNNYIGRRNDMANL